MFELFYHPIYTYGIDKESRFPRQRYELTYNALQALNGSIKFIQPEMVNVEDIYLSHDKTYVDAFMSGLLSDKEKRRIGLQPWNKNIVERTRYLIGGSIGALDSAVRRNGVAANMAGGTHHAHYSFGSGYCIFNDLAICALKCIKEYHHIRNVLIIDLDVHQGDGTATIFSRNSKVFTFSMHCKSNFPLEKMKSDVDVPIEKGVEDVKYLEILTSHLSMLNKIKADIIFFQAGVDGLKEDSLGHLCLTREGLKKRNQLIIDLSKDKKIPLVVFMGGGYSKPINHSVNAFVDLFKQCSQ